MGRGVGGGEPWDDNTNSEVLPDPLDRVRAWRVAGRHLSKHYTNQCKKVRLRRSRSRVWGVPWNGGGRGHQGKGFSEKVVTELQDFVVQGDRAGPWEPRAEGRGLLGLRARAPGSSERPPGL